MWSHDTKAVLFDCDGVMFDSRTANVRFYNAILHHVGLPDMSPEEEDIIHMKTTYQSIEYVLRDRQDLVDRAFDYYGTLDYALFLKYMTEEPDLKDTLRYLKRKYRTALVTNRTNTIGMIVSVHGLEEFFDMVVSALDVRNPKPHAEPLEKVLRAFGLHPGEAAYVGDSSVDEEAARAADVPLIAFRNPSLKADLHIRNLSELKKVF